MKIVLILVMLAFVSLGAQETAPKKTDPYNWYFYVAGGGGKATSFGVNAVTAGGQTGFEYRPNPYLGFGLGVGASNWAVKTETDYQKNLFIIAGSGIISRGAALYLLPIAAASRSEYTITYNNYQANFNFHMNGEKTFDPYIGIGVIGGSCTGVVKCTITGGELRLGLQINFNRMFIFIQAQGQTLNFKEEGNTVVSNASNGMGIFGLGVRF
ncbi:MAG: hypothetical protein KBF93_11590 [Leptospiraceae bacterium]|nr:hypothetical protein [Leptospiraceae bacterium]